MNAKTKRQKKRESERTPHLPRRGTTARRGYLILAVSVLVAAVATWALFEYVIWNTTPPELVGKWVVTQGPQVDSEFEFYRNGTMLGHVNLDGEHRVLKARIRVDGDRIYATTRSEETGDQLTRVQTIRKLTRTNLVLRDEQGKLLVMIRAQ